MKNTYRTIAAGVAAYATWRVLSPTPKRTFSRQEQPTELTRMLRRYAMNILMIALWKTFQEVIPESPAKRISA